jgi:hypothetical protein
MIIRVNAVYLDVMPCTLVSRYQCLGLTCCRHLQDIRANHATKFKYKCKKRKRRDRERRIEMTKEASKQGGKGGET